MTENDAYASLVLDEKLNKCTLPLVDRRLAARLVYDTLEHLLTLDYALNSLMAKPDTDIKLRNVLRLGACQILLEDRIPESAACNTSVALCKELGMEGLAGATASCATSCARRTKSSIRTWKRSPSRRCPFGTACRNGSWSACWLTGARTQRSSWASISRMPPSPSART